MWWVQVAAFLPKFGLCLDRFWGRNTADAGVRVGGLDLEMTENGWNCSFDGVGQLTSVAALARGPQGASAPSRPLRFSVRGVAAAPLWDMYADSGAERRVHASEMHIQQAFTTTGGLTVDQRTWDLEGVGFKNHSSGRRDFGNWHGHRFLLIVAAEWTAHLLVVEDEQRNPLSPSGAFFRNGRRQSIQSFSLPRMDDACGGPTTGDMAFGTSEGDVFEFEFELIHALPITITEANDNINGVDWDLGGNPALFVGGTARLLCRDGSVAYAYVERGAHQSAIPRPQCTSLTQPANHSRARSRGATTPSPGTKKGQRST
jgi:hypothetical protein